jgi:hypothetical protein
VDMGGSVIVHIDSHAQAIEAKDSWHWWIFNLIAWVFQGGRWGVKYTFLFLATFTPYLCGKERRSAWSPKPPFVGKVHAV